MPIVRNTAAAPRGLCWMPVDVEGVVSAAGIERVVIPPGGALPVEPRFLESEGAKALLESGELVVEDVPAPSFGAPVVEDVPAPSFGAPVVEDDGIEPTGEE